MTPQALLEDLRGRGVRIEARGDRLRVEAPAGLLTPALWGLLVEQKPALLRLLAPAPALEAEIARRVEAFRQRIDAWRAASRPGVPLLILPEAPDPREGACVSCGVALAPKQTWRCSTCLAAVALALGLAPDG